MSASEELRYINARIDMHMLKLKYTLKFKKYF